MTIIAEFEITEHHLTLLRHAYVDWSGAEFGAPRISPKRPYGNSDVIGDIIELLNVDEDTAVRLHKETEIALQIVLVTGKFAPGKYIKRQKYDNRSWAISGEEEPS